MKTLYLIPLAFLATSIFAYTQYDYKSGNSYTVTQSGGNTYVQGYNIQKGTNWNTTIDQNGNQHGRDSTGNYWSSNTSGSYYNTNGKTCYGTGIARTCN